MQISTKDTFKLTHLKRNEFIAAIYERYGKKLYHYAIREWKVNEDQAWDLVYKTLYRVIEVYRKYAFENEEKFAGFVFRIFINYLKNHYRDNKLKIQIESRDIENEGAGEIPIELSETESNDRRLKILKEMLDELEDWQRILLLMRSTGQSYSEIAKYIHKPEDQLKVYYQRLKEQLSKKINERL